MADVASKPGTRHVTRYQASHLDEARAAVGTTFYPHRLAPLERAPDLSMSLRTVQLGPIMLGRLGYGADVSLDFGELGNAYHVSIPLSGRVEAVCGGETSVSTCKRAAVYLPAGRTTITRWSADCVQYGVKIEREYLESVLESMIGRPVRSPVRFPFTFDVTDGAAAEWLRLVQTLAADLDLDTSMLYDPLMADQLARAVTTGLLLATGHEYQELLRGRTAPVRPRTVKRAIDAMEANPERPFTLPELAELVGCSVRSLQEAFRRYVGVPPMTYLRDVRLQRVHEDLSAADGTASVAEVAYRWGFHHLGRFAADYRRRYGVSPSRTRAM
ncbi:AraC family transcriptional regulator [Planosporangium mesophilum]|uniref:AraC family transcriptional regulator n=1 Tax=Planosporangium mesophilum TaxID=689768 RepID=A0A8J3TD86_9ACTN|nr:AraC family transcriptional regulator [Planosporangium mesophilum]NJC86285.1 AraC family transcriptional regulator [Planosporangium mesophilum]GII23306.1 AraC family transcriptional regulator [Planosporangium mesophilum]